MPFLETNGVRYYTFQNLAMDGVTQAVFTRQGGVSPAPWSSLNVGGTVGDDPQRVVENRRRVFHALNRGLESLYDVWQVHGRDVACADAPRPQHVPHLKADAILTDQVGVTLFMRFADCVPILLYDPVKRVVGMVHAGWQGTVHRAAASAVETLRDRYEVEPHNILAGIGPSIGPDHYEVGPDVIQKVRQEFGSLAENLLYTNGRSSEANLHPRCHLDLWQANRLILEEAGVEKIEVAEICTVCSLENWYSHRAEHGHTGRFGAMIALT